MPEIKTLLAIATISSLGVFAGSLIAPIEVRLIQNLTGNPAVTGSIFGFASILLAFFSYIIGRMSDVYGRRRVVMFGLLFGIVYAVLYSLVFNFLQIFGVKFAWAISVVATGPVLAAYLQDYLHSYKNKGRYFGYVYSAQAIFGSVGALLGGYVAAFYEFDWVFYIMALIYFSAFLFAFIFLPADKESGTSKLSNESKEKRTLMLTIKYVMSKPALLFYTVINTSFGINWGVKFFLWPLFIFEIAGSDFITGSIFATMGFVAFILLPFAGAFVDKFGFYKVLLLELIILGVAGIGLALSDNVLVFWLFAALYTVGEVLNGPAQAVLLTENIDQQIRGEVMGLDSTFDQLLAVLSPVIAGLLVTLVGLTVTFFAFVSLYWLSLIFGLYIYKKRLSPAGVPNALSM